MSAVSTLYDVPLQRITGEPTTLAEFQGKVLLIVNVASQCGFTPQYEALEKLYNTYKHCGFAVLGFPSNDFAGQEPGTDQEIQKFCSTSAGATFPLFRKSSVTGPAASELYQSLIAAQPVAQRNDPGLRAGLEGFLESSGGNVAGGSGNKLNPPPHVAWNFEKFVVDRRGRVTARFASDIAPDDPRVIRALESALPPLEGSTPTHS